MVRRQKSQTGQQPALSRERIIEAGLALVDDEGLNALSMRRLAQSLGVEAMSLYNHVANKNDLLDGMVDRVFSEIELPDGKDWRESMRLRAVSARRVLAERPWAIGLLNSAGSPGPATLRHHDWVIGALRTGGFSLPVAAHAFAVLDSFIYGFVVQESSLPTSSSGDMQEIADEILASMPVERYPYLTEMTADHILKPGYDFFNSFEFGLDLILDGLEKHRTS